MFYKRVSDKKKDNFIDYMTRFSFYKDYSYYGDLGHLFR